MEYISVLWNKFALRLHDLEKKVWVLRHHQLITTGLAGQAWSEEERRRSLLTTCRCGWSSRCCPAGCPAVGTTASPPRWSRSWWGWTWPGPDLEEKDPHTSYRMWCQRRHIRARASGSTARGEPTKVGQLELPSLVDQQVLGLQVSVENLPLVAVGQTSQQLEQEELKPKSSRGGHWEHWSSTRGKTHYMQIRERPLSTRIIFSGTDWS